MSCTGHVTNEKSAVDVHMAYNHVFVMYTHEREHCYCG